MPQSTCSQNSLSPMRPSPFRPFTKESIKAIKARQVEEKAKKIELDRKRSVAEARYAESIDGPSPDSRLEQGMQLPIRLAVAFDVDMAGALLEDVDPFYKSQETFIIVTKKGEIFRFSATNSVFLFSPFNPLRRLGIAILTHSLFSLFIIATIMTNCGIMIKNDQTLSDSTELIFTVIYTFESALKLVARGFILEPFTYLRDAWNWLDFVVIVLAYITMWVDLGNLSVLRTFRVLRALKTVAVVPGLKTIVGAVIESVKNLRDVIILTMFSLSVFALLGLQIYMGVLTQKCIKKFPDDFDYSYPFENETWHQLWASWNGNETNWFIKPNENDYKLCGNSTGAGTCPENYTCLAGYGGNPNYGYTSFDSFHWAFLSAFRLMNQDYWEALYQQILRSAGAWHITFFIVIIFLGSYYLVNLILAIVAMSYDDLQKKAKDDEDAALAELDAIRAEEEAYERAQQEKMARKASRLSAKDKHSQNSDKQSQFSGAGDEVASLGNLYKFDYDVYSVRNGSQVKLHSGYGSSRLALELEQQSASVPNSPYYYRSTQSSFHHRHSLKARDGKKVMTLSTYMDAQEHLPYADDSTAVTPIWSENKAAFVLPPFVGQGNESRYSPSHSSRLSSISRGSCNRSKIANIEEHQEDQLNHFDGKSFDTRVDDLSVSKGHCRTDDTYFQSVITMVEIQDQFSVENVEQESLENQEDDTLANRVKKIVIKLLLRCIDVFCVWNCGFPWSWFQKLVAIIVFDPFCELLITIVIVLNTVFMALDHHGLDEKPVFKSILKTGNEAFSYIFFAECVMKLIAMSPKFYFQVGWNVFDFFIVALSFMEMILEGSKLPGISAFRSFRLLRVFKLAKSWPTLNLLISIMGKTMGALGNLVLVLIIIIFIFAVMGMQLFGQKYTEKVFPNNELPRWHFKDFGHSFMIIFRILCGEWIETMWDCMRTNGASCVPFFIAAVVIGNLVVLNLFLALLLSSFGASNLSAPTADADTNKLAEAFNRIWRFINWIKSSIRSLISFIYRQIRKVENCVWRPKQPQEETQTELTESTKTTTDKPVRTQPGQKKSRLGDTARLVIQTKKLLDDVKQSQKASEKNDAANTSDDDMYEDITLSDEDKNDYDWDEDETDPENMKIHHHSTNDEEEVQYASDCFPAVCYEKFPFFPLEDSPYMAVWLKIRSQTYRLVENKYFETLIITLILLSSLALAVEDIHLPKYLVLSDVLFYMDRIFTVVFFIEMCIKWVALGFVAYFTNAWCWLDFVIVMVSLVNIGAALAGAGKVQAFKTMRTLRALRPLRAMSRMQGMRIVVNALLQAIPSIFNVLLVCLIFWLIFAIMGVQLFAGKFYKCVNVTDNSVINYTIVPNRSECTAANYSEMIWPNSDMKWVNSEMNFDHVGKAYLSLFQVATFKGWIQIMSDASDTRELDQQPEREANFVMYLYFVIFIIFGAFFTLNLFIGVIIDNFNEQKKKTGNSMELFMTEDQKKYYAAMKKMGSKKPLKAIPRPTWKPQATVFDLVTNQKFDVAIMLLIGVNMLTMTMDHYKMSKEWDTLLEVFNTVFIAIFTAECVLKIFALRYHYFKEAWNLFDFVVVILSICGMVLSDLIEKYFVSPTLLRVVRVAKIGRVLRLIKGARGIRTLLFALAMSLPALFNICLLLFLVMFIYAIFGMSFFMNVKLDVGGLDDVYNFQTFGQSFILLFQMSTSAGWDGVLTGITNQENCTLPDFDLGIPGDCGSPVVGITYILSYLVVTFLIIINMYIAVILENYSQATEEVQEGLTDDDYDMYYEIWAQFDPKGTQYIEYCHLSDFLDVLEPPLQIFKPNKYKIISMDIPICKGDMMYCVDILDSLTRDFFARKGNPVNTTMEFTDVQVVVNRPGYEVINSTLWRQREEYCAKLLQKIFRQRKGRDVKPIN